jgi:hypothetical protein
MKIINIMVLIKTQSGKTGSMCSFIEKYLENNLMDISNIYKNRKSGFSKDKSNYRIYPCYTDENTIQWWVIYFSIITYLLLN